MKRFSIITVCRNNLEELINTYDSVYNQDQSLFEWIVVDGNSSDGTKEWLADNNTSQWVSEPDDGIFDAMNKGIHLSTGEFLIFMNSGDTFANYDVLKNVNEFIVQNNTPYFIYGDSIDVDEKGGEHYRKAKHFSKNWIGMITQHQAMFFNKNALDESTYSYDYPITADYAFISEFLERVDRNKIHHIGIPICKFSMGGTNETHRIKALRED